MEGENRSQKTEIEVGESGAMRFVDGKLMLLELLEEGHSDFDSTIECQL